MRALSVVSLLVAALIVVEPGVAEAHHGTASGQSFTFLDPVFDQEIVGISPAYMEDVAFAPDGDPVVTPCVFASGGLRRFDLQSSAPTQHGTALHPESTVSSNTGCGITNHPDGNAYSNTTSGVTVINPDTGAHLGTMGPGGNALGITVDPVNGHVVYVGADCRFASTCTLIDLDPTTGSASNFAVLPSSEADFIEGIHFSPSGSHLFLATRSPAFRLTVLDRTGTIVQHVPLTSEPDGIAFKTTAPQFVVTSNLDGTLTRFDFPGNDFAQTPSQSVLASGGFRGRLGQVGPDSCLYLTQSGTRFDDGTVENRYSLVRICPGIDTTAPETTIDFGPDARTNRTEDVFAFSSDEDPDVTYTCVLDGGDPYECTSPAGVGDLDDGEHSFSVFATDLAGNEDDTPATSTWVVDTTAPTTSIDDAPEGTVALTSATIVFSSEDGATFACSLDEAEFAVCTSPVEYTDLADGTHTFEVKASDDLGNTEDPTVSTSWTVDTTPGDTTIDDGPDELTNATDAHFIFSTEDSPATFECQLDGEGFGPCPTTPVLETDARTTEAACVVPCGGTGGRADYTDLEDGGHTFEVRALDGVDNTDPTPATFTWTIDTVVPNTFITTPPDDVETSRSVSIPFTSDDETATFECDLDEEGWTACTSPFTADDLADGSHTFEVRALDGAGNVDDSPATATWTVDATAPDTILTSAPAGTETTDEASFEFASDDETATFECDLDDGGWEDCTSPAVRSDLTDGEHTFFVRAIDTAGNPDTSPATVTWIVDTTAPNTRLTSQPSNGTSTTAQVTFDAIGERATFRCSLDGAAYAVCTSPRTLRNLSVGNHSFRVVAVDSLGNQDATPAVAAWRVDAPAAKDGHELFTDVDDDNQFTKSIGKLAASGVTKGCNDEGTKFCPTGFVTRGQMAAFFERALDLPAGTKVFTDTGGHRFQADIAAFERRGITKGCNDAQTKFCPDDFVTRGQMAAFFTRAQNLPAGTKVFTDTRGHRFQADIAAFERRGITKGCNDEQTKFCPDDFVTREQMAAFFDRAGLLD